MAILWESLMYALELLKMFSEIFGCALNVTFYLGIRGLPNYNINLYTLHFLAQSTDQKAVKPYKNMYIKGKGMCMSASVFKYVTITPENAIYQRTSSQIRLAMSKIACEMCTLRKGSRRSFI